VRLSFDATIDAQGANPPPGGGCRGFAAFEVTNCDLKDSLCVVVKSYPLARRIRRGEQLPDGVENDLELVVVAALESANLAGEFIDGKGEAAQTQKGANNGNAGLHGAGAVENIGSHESAVFGERERCVTTTTATGL
jgi:hypothetical protein